MSITEGLAAGITHNQVRVVAEAMDQLDVVKRRAGMAAVEAVDAVVGEVDGSAVGHGRGALVALRVDVDGDVDAAWSGDGLQQQQRRGAVAGPDGDVDVGIAWPGTWGGEKCQSLR